MSAPHSLVVGGAGGEPHGAPPFRAQRRVTTRAVEAAGKTVTGGVVPDVSCKILDMKKMLRDNMDGVAYVTPFAPTPVPAGQADSGLTAGFRRPFSSLPLTGVNRPCTRTAWE